MSFRRLRLLCEISDHEKGYLDFILEWESKRNALQVNISDLPKLVEDFKKRSQTPYPLNAEITLSDKIPSVRLANACESVSHLVYSMSEIAARLANKIDERFPASFNALRKKVRNGKFDEKLIDALGDLQWYERVREIRTEWAHYSSPFVGIDGCDPLIVLRSFRSKDDRVHFASRVTFKIPELQQWAASAFQTIDGLADYLFRYHLLDSLDYSKTIGQPVRDANGFPIVKDGRIQTETMTIRDFMFRYKILERLEDLETWSRELRIPIEKLLEELADITPFTGPLPDGTIPKNALYMEKHAIEAWKRVIEKTAVSESAVCDLKYRKNA